MPTWAIIITQVIAVYGALLSTLNFLRAGPKLRFKAEPVARAPFLEPTADFVQTEVTNDGGRPTTLTSITIRYFNNRWSWARLRNRPTKEAVFYDRYPVQPLPYKLKPGGVWRGSCVWRGSTPQADLTGWGTKGAWYFDLYHSHSARPVRKRVRFKAAELDAGRTKAEKGIAELAGLAHRLTTLAAERARPWWRRLVG